MASEPTTHRVEYTVELGRRAIGPSPGGVYKKSTKDQKQKQEKEEHADISSGYPAPTLIKEYRKLPMQIEDKARLVWIPLPTLGNMAKHRDFSTLSAPAKY